MLGPLFVTKIYEKYGTYFMIGSVTATLTVSLIITVLSYKTLVPSNGLIKHKHSDRKTGPDLKHNFKFNKSFAKNIIYKIYV